MPDVWSNHHVVLEGGEIGGSAGDIEGGLWRSDW